MCPITALKGRGALESSMTMPPLARKLRHAVARRVERARAVVHDAPDVDDPGVAGAGNFADRCERWEWKRASLALFRSTLREPLLGRRPAYLGPIRISEDGG